MDTSSSKGTEEKWSNYVSILKVEHMNFLKTWTRSLRKRGVKINSKVLAWDFRRMELLLCEVRDWTCRISSLGEEGWYQEAQFGGF